MAGSAVLEQEIARQEVFAARERELTSAEREHRRNMPANYNVLRYSDNRAWADPSARANEQFEFPEAFREEENERRASAPQRSAPVWNGASASAQTIVRNGNLFEDVNFIDGDLVYTRDLEAFRQPETPARPAEQSAPAERYEAVTAATATDLPAVDDDAVPTRRTMDTLNRPMAVTQSESTNETRKQTGFLSALSLKAKIILASVAAAIVLAIAIICINTGLINSLDGRLADLRVRASEEQQTYENIMDEIESFNDPNNETVRLWAEEHGMSRP